MSATGHDLVRSDSGEPQPDTTFKQAQALNYGPVHIHMPLKEWLTYTLTLSHDDTEAPV